ncbi:ABC transporter ATP-binding protein [Castellaniella sp. GW247-6E4]|uniref:ABC transporter ATP-binding protein n=1 Tax=Castellaniella sp. GW247-6E4 TaxID=3140380 RepID=UPI003314B78D
MLELENLSRTFGGLKAVNNVSFRLHKGEILGLIGPNGAGKTTLFNCVAGAIKPSSGAIRLEGQNIAGYKSHRVCRMGLGRTYQIVRPFNNLSVFDNVVVGALNRSRKISEARQMAREAIETTGLGPMQDSLAGSLTLPGRKRLEIARALATGPRLLLLDEVMAGLNPTEVEAAIELIRKIRESGITILIIEHLMRVISSVSDRIVVLHHGQKLAEGDPGAVLNDPAVVEAYLGEDFLA